MAASPIVLTSRTGGSATSVASASRRDREAPELIGWDFLAEAGEADEVGEAHGHLARPGQAPAAALHRADDLALGRVAQVQGQQVAQQGVQQRVELGGRPPRSARRGRAR